MKIKISFNKWSKERILAGKKFCTSRNEVLGELGDWFEVGDKKFVLIDVTSQSLLTVKTHYFDLEGAKSQEEFTKVWNNCYPEKKFNPKRIVHTHAFKELSGL